MVCAQEEKLLTDTTVTSKLCFVSHPFMCTYGGTANMYLYPYPYLQGTSNSDSNLN